MRLDNIQFNKINKTMREKVVVILINYNQNDYTIKCVNSLLNSSYDNFDILLTDNGSSEENYLFLERELDKYPKVHLKD